ncbi:MAG TPA: glycosyltransferase [Candidatus Acidoferrales bacterium]|nr:glycosyltransferase [Candidatus Acidoferrales bacterium]
MQNDVAEMRNRNLSLCLLCFPFASPTMEIFLLNYLELVCPLCSPIFAITGGMNPRQTRCPISFKDLGLKLHYVKDVRPLWWSVMLRGFKILIIELKMAAELFKIRRAVDVVTFCGTAYFSPSILLAKALRKKTSVLAWGLQYLSKEKTPAMMTTTERIDQATVKLSEKVALRLADQIDVESESATHFLGLEEYAEKIAINGAPYIDRDLFLPTKPFDERNNVIGYVGRLHESKGIMNFVGAIPLLIQRFKDLRFVIIGEGVLQERITDQLERENVGNYVTCTGWVPHEALPRYLNDLKILVLPSYSEGLPGIVQEAMSCGVLVLATNVGAIPDMITDGETGFILEENSPGGIADSVSRIIDNQNLTLIARQAEQVVEKEYAYEAMVRKCAQSLGELVSP